MYVRSYACTCIYTCMYTDVLHSSAGTYVYYKTNLILIYAHTFKV